MKLKKALKILQDFIGYGPDAEPVDFDSAVALGAEALKQVQQNRTTNLDISYKPLPGETE